MNCFLPILIFLSTKNILTSRVSLIFLLKKVIILKEMMENLPMKRDYLLTEEGRSPQSRGKYSLKAFRSFLLLTYLLYVSLVLNWFYSRKHTEVKLEACLKLSSHSCFVCLEQQEEETSLKPASTMKCTESQMFCTLKDKSSFQGLFFRSLKKAVYVRLANHRGHDRK